MHCIPPYPFVSSYLPYPSLSLPFQSRIPRPALLLSLVKVMCDDKSNGAEGFCLATFEAAIQHLLGC